MNTDFCLIDLISQAVAVESLLYGKSAEEKIAWLSSHGTLTLLPKRQPDERQIFLFETPIGSSCRFFVNGDEFVFLGDHTTFTVSDYK